MRLLSWIEDTLWFYKHCRVCSPQKVCCFVQRPASEWAGITWAAPRTWSVACFSPPSCQSPSLTGPHPPAGLCASPSLHLYSQHEALFVRPSLIGAQSSPLGGPPLTWSLRSWPISSPVPLQPFPLIFSIILIIIWMRCCLSLLSICLFLLLEYKFEEDEDFVVLNTLLFSC